MPRYSPLSGFWRPLLTCDLRQSVDISAGDGTYTIDGLDWSLANLANATTKEVTVANGLYLLHDAGANPDPTATLDLKTELSNVGHTFDPAAYEYRISWAWDAYPANGLGVTAILIDNATQRTTFGSRLGNPGTIYCVVDGNDALADYTGPVGSGCSMIIHGHVFDFRHATKDPDAWNGSTVGMTRLDSDERSFENTNQNPSVQPADWDLTTVKLQFVPRAANDSLKLYRLWVAARDRA